MIELLIALFVLSVLGLVGQKYHWEIVDFLTYAVGVLLVIIGLIIKNRKPTFPDSDGY